MRLRVFRGPSIDAERVLVLQPRAEVAPPIKRGDLLRSGLGAGDIALIIDGFFFQSASIQHMEIIDALARGVRVVGASSMGALRAAELYPVGMRGVGSIFERFRSGELRADDEVAVMHSQDDYQCYSDALVNIRHNLRRAVDQGVLSRAGGEYAVAQLQRRWFGHRSYKMALKLLREGGFEEEAQRLRSFWDEGLEDIKRRDAELALTGIEDVLAPEHVPAGIPVTVFRDVLRKEYSLVSERWFINEMDVLRYCQVREQDMPALYRETALVELLDRLEGIGVPGPGEAPTSGDEEPVARWRRAHQRAAALREERACSLEMLAHAALVAHGHLTAEAPENRVEEFIYPLVIPPGQLSTHFLLAMLKQRGLFQSAATELVQFVETRLSSRVGLEVIRFGLSERSHVMKLYASLWGVAESQVEEAARRRGFLDLEQFFASAGRLLLTSKIGTELRRR